MSSSKPSSKSLSTKKTTAMKKILLLITLTLTLTLTLSAGVKNATTLCVEDKTGAVLKFSLADRPKISFRGNYTVIQAAEIKLLQFRNLYKAYFTDEEDPTAINEVSASGMPQASIVNGEWSMANFKPLTNVLIYDTRGNLVRKAQTDVQGAAQVSVGDLPSGIYIVKAGKMKFKIAY